MKPKVGELWINRKNEVIKIVHYSFGNSFPLVGMNSKGKLLKYSRDGLITGIDFKSDDDLVMEFKSENK